MLPKEDGTPAPDYRQIDPYIPVSSGHLAGRTGSGDYCRFVASQVSEFLTGVGMLGRGLALILKRRRMFVIGALPPLITSILFTVVLVVLITQAEAIVDWLTPFADGWARGVANVFRVLVGLAVVAAPALLMVVTFSALTLTLGAPLYDKISESVDRELGPTPEPPDEPVLTSLARGLRQSLVLIAICVPVGLLLFLAGFIPVVGQVAVPAVSAVFGGWMLSIELIGSTFERRGLLRLSERRAAMRRSRARVLGFAVPTFLLLAIPFVAVLVFPVATAAGTILARDLLATPDRRESVARPTRS